MASKILKTLAVLAAANSVDAHTWVEMIRRISSTGAFVGETGYAMGHMNRTDTGFADTAVQVKFLDVTTNPTVCGDIGKAGYTNSLYPALSAAPGEFVAMQYAENGHVSFPDQTPRGFRGGNVMIYATSEDVNDVGINDALYSWNAEGTGGNQKGKLIASHFFDDGQCYENPNASPIRAERAAEYNASSLLCQSVAQIPEDLDTSDTVNLLWIWDWDQSPNIAGKNSTEIYTSCMTVNLQEADTDNAATNVKAFSFGKSVAVTDAAIPGQISTLIEVEARGTGTVSPAAVTDVPVATGGSSGSATTTASGSKSTKSGKASKSATKTKNQSGMVTVTVTAAAETVTQYETVTVDAGAGDDVATSTRHSSAVVASSGATSLKTSVRGSSSSQAAAATGINISVAPFLKARSTGMARRMR